MVCRISNIKAIMRKYDILMCVTHIMYSLSHQKWTRYCCDLYDCIHNHFVGINTHMLRIYIIFTLVVLWCTRCQRSNPAEMSINDMGQDTTIVRIVLFMCIIQWIRNHISWIKTPMSVMTEFYVGLVFAIFCLHHPRAHWVIQLSYRTYYIKYMFYTGRH